MDAIIILAAGASTRMGQAKQNLQFKEMSLLAHCIKEAIASRVGPVIVITGANEDAVLRHIDTETVAIVSNKNYYEGIASSIRAGVKYVMQSSDDCQNIILMVCDQPYVNAELLKKIVETTHLTSKLIVACAYKGTIGVPTLFNKSYFPELLDLMGDEGGKKIILNNPMAVTTIPFQLGSIDIDTEADYHSLLSKG